MTPLRTGLRALSVALACSIAAAADEPQHHLQHQHQQQNGAEAARNGEVLSGDRDSRQLAIYPPALRVHTLANMRDHLLTLDLIQEALAKGAFDEASELAEQRLGMTSLKLHGAHEASKYMPKGMQEAGSAMHHKASQFAIVSKDAGVTGDLRAVLASLAALNQTCVACHASYRIR